MYVSMTSSILNVSVGGKGPGKSVVEGVNTSGL